MEPLAFHATVGGALPGALARLTEALKQEGFGVLTHVDLAEAFKTKLGIEFRPYAILGVCNPGLAHRAITADPQAGLLLPCTATIEQTGPESSTVSIANPEAMLAVGDFAETPEIKRVATEARAKLARVADRLAGKPSPPT